MGFSISVIATCKLENLHETLSPQKTKSLNSARSFNPLRVIERTDKSMPLISNIWLEKSNVSNDISFYYLLRLRHIWLMKSFRILCLSYYFLVRYYGLDRIWYAGMFVQNKFFRANRINYENYFSKSGMLEILSFHWKAFKYCWVMNIQCNEIICHNQW